MSGGREYDAIKKQQGNILGCVVVVDRRGFRCAFFCKEVARRRFVGKKLFTSKISAN